METNANGNLIEILKIVPSWVALLFSSMSLVVSFLSFKVSKRKEEKSLPNFSFYLESGFITTLPDRCRVYSFALSLTNRSEASSSIVSIEGVLRGITQSGVDMSIRVPCSVDVSSESNLIRSGVKIAAGETLTGALHFNVTPHLLKNLRRIDHFIIAVIDGFGAQHDLDPGPLREVSQ